MASQGGLNSRHATWHSSAVLYAAELPRVSKLPDVLPPYLQSPTVTVHAEGAEGGSEGGGGEGGGDVQESALHTQRLS